MAVLTVAQLKALWINGFVPDETDYIDLFDSIEDLANNGGGGGAAVWGDVTGTLSDQTDLQNALNARAALAFGNANDWLSTNVFQSATEFNDAKFNRSVKLAGSQVSQEAGSIDLAYGGDHILRMFQTAVAIFAALDYSGLTASRTFTLPDKDGTLATLADISGGGGAPAWGAIIGTLSDQTDLQAALDGLLSLDTSAQEIQGIKTFFAGLRANGVTINNRVRLNANTQGHLLLFDEGGGGLRTVGLDFSDIFTGGANADIVFTKAGTVAMISDLPNTANFATTNTTQDINAEKRFLRNITVGTSGDDTRGVLLFEDGKNNLLVVNTGSRSALTTDDNGSLLWKGAGITSLITLNAQLLTANRQLQFPDKDGIIATLDDVGGGGDFLADGSVPMTGALNMGQNQIDALTRLDFNDAGVSNARILFFWQNVGGNRLLSFQRFGGGQNMSFNNDLNKWQFSQADNTGSGTVGLMTVDEDGAPQRAQAVTEPIVINSQIRSTKAVLTSVGGVIDWAANDNMLYEIVLTEDTVLNNPSGAVDGSSFRIRIKQDGTGLHALTFGSNFKFSNGTPPSITLDPNAKDYLTIEVDGSDLDCVEVQNFL